MSTKTTFKRIALVAVAALGLGVLTSVAPASAVNGQTATSISVGTIPASRVGQTVVVPVTIYLPATAVANDTITISAQLTSAPLSGGVANAASAGRPAATTANDTGAIIDVVTTAGAALTGGTNINGRTNAAGTLIAAQDGTYNQFAGSVQDEWVITAAAVELGYARVGIALTPDVAGSYTVMVATNATGANGFVAGSPTANFTVTPGSTPTTVTITNVRGSSILAGSPNGALVKLTLDGALGALENITLTTSGNGAISQDVSSPSFATTQVLDSADFASGAAHVLLRSSGTAAETITLVARGSGALSTSVTATSSYSVTAQAGNATAFATIEEPSADALYTSTAQAGTASAGYTVAPSSTSQTFGLSNAIRTAAAYGYATITDTLGLVTGVAGAKYDQIITFPIATAAAGTTFSVAGNFAAAATGASYSVTIKGGTSAFLGTDGDKTFTVTSATRTNAGGFTLTPSTTTYIAAPGAAITIAGELDDQFGAGRGAQEVTITTSGRNNPIATKVFTDAAGKFSFTTADASTSTTSLVDTITFAASGATSKSVTINYANTAVGTVTVTGGNTTASVTSLVNTVNPISVGSSTAGVEAGAIDVTATVKDALGNALAGVPVSFSVAGTGVAFTTTTATVYTGSTGTAVGKLYGWVAGTYTYTVTAGGKTTTGTATFGSITASNTRIVSASVAGNVVTGKAVDRLGNPVRNAALYAVATGGANIGGAFVATGTTAADGTISWVVTGSGDVTVTAVNPADPAGTTAYQTCALEGNRTCATAATAAVAYAATVAGTTTTAEKHVGATFAPAGVASAKVEVTSVDSAQTAADAAAEATDAANAATDAANAAAEAADAATAAAQDAADAVAALSTQVSELVSALRKQITSLTNLVIKIQKKVRA
jgi:trimeric autotransporter adhesin